MLKLPKLPPVPKAPKFAMPPIPLKRLILAGTSGALLVAVVVGAALLAGGPQPDAGGIAGSHIQGGTPVARNDPMREIAPDEASKRASVNDQAAQAAKQAGATYVAPPVITETTGPRPGEIPTPPVSQSVAPPVAPAPANASQPIAAPQAIAAGRAASATQPQIIYAYPQPVADQAVRERINSQVDALMKPPSGAFVTRVYAPPPPAAAGAAGNAASNARQLAAAATTSVIAARPGDTAYATLDRGFNSLDPTAPIFATIFDYRDNGTTGPLHGSRVMGQITFNRDQAALTFASLVMPSGFQIPIKALGISDADGRTGVAASVDYHTLERYSGLLIGGLIQGAGQVGQQLIQNNQSYVYTPTGMMVSQSQPSTLAQIGMAAAAPLGTALSTVAAAQFNKPPTISSPQGMGLGVVFLEPVQLPTAQVAQSAAITAAGGR